MLLWVVFLALFLICAGMCSVFLVYICVVWCASMGQWQPDGAAKAKPGRGLSASELERLPGVEDGGKVEGAECAVCLEEMVEGQETRVMPECRHTFHRQCADVWLSSNAVCPVCRARLRPPSPPPDEAEVCDAV